MFLYSKPLNFLTSAILAGNCGIAAGIAWALKEEGSTSKVWCFLGDGAEDEGHFYEAAMFVEGHDLPCTFIVEDNDRSVDTSVLDRRGPFSVRYPFQGWNHVRRYRYKPTYPHGGAGLTQMITFNPEIVAKHSNPN
jgi:transketolase N-terminal domain/subunit